MEIKIFRKGEETPVFVSLVNSVAELRGILAFVKEKDREAGITTTYEVPQLSKLAKQELSDATDLYFYSQAKLHGGYLNMGEIERDKKTGDQDALFLDALYDAIWEKEEELEKQIDKMSLEELLNLDIEKLCKEAYDPIVKELSQKQQNTQDNQEGSTNE